MLSYLSTKEESKGVYVNLAATSNIKFKRFRLVVNKIKVKKRQICIHFFVLVVSLITSKQKHLKSAIYTSIRTHGFV